MKQNYTLFIVAAAFVSATSFAQTPIVAESQMQEFVQPHPISPAQKSTLARHVKGQYAKPSVMKAAPSDLITEQPAGELKTLVGNLGGYYSIFGYILSNPDMGRAVDIVYGDDGNVYFKDPFSQFATGTWLKGTVNGDIISVDAQPIYYEETSGMYDATLCYACKMKYGYVEDMGQNYWAIDMDDPTLRFTVRNDSIIMENENGYAGLGMFYSDGEWTGFGEYRKILSPQTDVAVSLPETAEAPRDYVMTYGTYLTGLDTLTTMRQLVTLAEDGDDRYLSGLTGNDDHLYVKGTFADGKLTLKSGQYMGLENTGEYNSTRYFDYFEAMDWKTVPSYNGSYEDETYFKDQFVFDYDAATDTYAGENSYLAVNGGNTKVNMRNGFKKPVLTPYVEVKEAPAKPSLYSVEDCYEEYGYSYVEAILTNTTAKGDFLDTRRIYYTLSIDDEQWTFMPDEYVSLDEEMTDVPYSYVDNEDFQTFRGRRVIYFFTTDFSKVSLQEYYVDSDGVKHYSEPAVWNPTGIQHATGSSTGSVKAVSYYDLSGCLVGKPVGGFYIKNTTFADGSSKKEKIVAGKN